MADFYVREEDGTSKYILEDGSGDYLLETSPNEVDPGFVASVTVLYAPDTNPRQLSAPFVASATVLYTVFLETSPVTFTSSGSFVVPPDVLSVTIQATAPGGGGGGAQFNGSTLAGAGGGGGAFASGSVPVTPLATYTVTIGSPGTGGSGAVFSPAGDGTDGGDASFTGDSAVAVVAKGGKGGQGNAGTGGAGGLASGSTGDVKHSGGSGGNGLASASAAGSGGGGAAGTDNDGSNGVAATGTTEGAGGAGGSTGGGHGGSGSNTGGNNLNTGLTVPGGGGGGGGFHFDGGPGAGGQIVISWKVVYPSFISSTTQVYAPAGLIGAPFIASHTTLYPVFSIFSETVGVAGPGNGGEIFAVQLAPNGTTENATLAVSISTTDALLQATGDGGYPASGYLVVTIDSETLYVGRISAGLYRIVARGVSNTTPASHTAGATVAWGDSYDQAIQAEAGIGANFTGDITGSGSTTYQGFLICFDSSQAYLSGSRYPMHVTEVLGVFDAGAGSSGSSRLDSAQPNAVCTPATTSEDCPAALSNPALILTNIAIGDVGVVRYQNPEASVMTLGPRSVALQSWYGLKRVDATDHDVTFTDPTGYVVDTNPGTGRFAACAEEVFLNPSAIGINPDTGGPTDRAVAYTTTTLTGTLRFFTFGPPHYSEKGWPIGCLAVRQGLRRVPFWKAFDWHNYNYVYAGFGTDCTFAQMIVNRNGIVFGSTPIINLPGPQDITGPDAMWDDGSYRFATSWYVALFSTPYAVIGPSVGGSSPNNPVPPVAGDGFVPGVGFGSGGAGGTPTVPTSTEGGSGGGIEPPQPGAAVDHFDAQLV